MQVLASGEGPSGRFSMAGESLDPQMGGVLVFIGGCNKNLEALDDMYYLHTGFIFFCSFLIEKSQVVFYLFNWIEKPLHNFVLLTVRYQGFLKKLSERKDGLRSYLWGNSWSWNAKNSKLLLPSMGTLLLELNMNMILPFTNRCQFPVIRHQARPISFVVCWKFWFCTVFCVCHMFLFKNLLNWGHN